MQSHVKRNTKYALIEMAEFINAHKDLFTNRLTEMRTLWFMAYNCNDEPAMKKLLDILNSKRVKTGQSLTLTATFTNTEYQYHIK